MRKLNNNAGRTLEKMYVAAQASESGAIKIDRNGPESGIMAVCVEILETEGNRTMISVAHYYGQNGDLMRDPDVVFLRVAPAEYYPAAMRQDGAGGFDRMFAKMNEKLEVTHFNVTRQRDCAFFCNTWMKNIKWQQADFFKK